MTAPSPARPYTVRKNSVWPPVVVGALTPRTCPFTNAATRLALAVTTEAPTRACPTVFIDCSKPAGATVHARGSSATALAPRAVSTCGSAAVPTTAFVRNVSVSTTAPTTPAEAS